MCHTCSFCILSSNITDNWPHFRFLPFIHSVLLQFFFKATLLQQVNDLLGSIRKNLNAADSIVEELERSIMPVLKELDDIQDKIKNMEHIEEIAHEIENLKKKLAWAWVYDVDKKIGEQTEKLEKLRERIPACQERIDRNTVSCSFMGTILCHFFLEQSNILLYIYRVHDMHFLVNCLACSVSSQVT